MSPAYSRVLTVACSAAARLAAQGGSLMSGHVDVQVKSCIEWLQGEDPNCLRLLETTTDVTVFQANASNRADTPPCSYCAN